MSAVRGHSVPSLQANPYFFASASSSPPQKEKYASPEELLTILRSQLKNETGDWLTTLRGHIATELATVADSYEKDALKAALQNLLKGELEFFTDDLQLANDLVNVQETLVIQVESLLFSVLTQREKILVPLPALIRLAAIDAVKTSAKDLEIELQQESNDEKIVLEDNLFFIANKQYVFNELIAVINTVCKRHNLHDDMVIQHALLREAGVPECPLHCYINQYLPPESSSNPIYREIAGHFIMDMSLPLESVNKFVNFTNQTLGEGSAEKVVTSYSNLYTLQLNVKAFAKKLLSSEFQKFLADYLGNPIIAMNYQVSLHQRILLESAIHQCFNEMGHQYKVTAKGFLGNCVLRTFGIYTESPACTFNRAKRYEGFAFDIDFFFEISAEEAQQLVAHINSAFPNSAKVIVHEKELFNEERKPVQQIGINAKVLTSNNFKKKIAITLSNIAKGNIDLLERFQLRSGSITQTRDQISKNLLTIAMEYKDSDAVLFNSLMQFSFFACQREEKEKLKKASFEVELAISGHESTYKNNPQGLKLFKEGNKKSIKAMQRELGARESKPHDNEERENSFSR